MQKIIGRFSVRGSVQICALMVALLVGTLMIAPSSAQQSPLKSPFGIAVPPSTGSPSDTNIGGAPADASAIPRTAEPVRGAGVVARAWDWLLQTQSKLNRDMAGAVRQLKSDNPIAAAATLIMIAFGYGVLHAAGPGHGKAVISSYVLANEETVRRGIALSFLAAIFQALSAIAFVGVLALVLNQTSLQMRSTEATIETISWGLVAAVGAYLLWKQLAPLARRSRQQVTTSTPSTGAAQPFPIEHPAHRHGPDCGCGHAHMPSPQDLQGAWSWKTALPIALSIGIRPCSGAILLLIFALSQGMLWAGILGTFAMAVGTAITVSILAAMAVSSRNWAARYGGRGSVWAERVQVTAGIVGASLVLLFGVAFFIASLKGGSPL